MSAAWLKELDIYQFEISLVMGKKKKKKERGGMRKRERERGSEDETGEHFKRIHHLEWRRGDLETVLGSYLDINNIFS